MAEYFKDIPKIKYEGVNSTNPLSFKYYNPDEVVMGKTMREQLKFALSWWHTMGGDGTDMFGCGTTDKTWGEAAPEARAKKKVDVAFEIMDKLSIDYFCFHDRDLSPEYGDLGTTNAKLAEVVDYIAEKWLLTLLRSFFGVLLSASITQDICMVQAHHLLLMFSLMRLHRSRTQLTLLSNLVVRATFSGAEEKDMRLF